MGCGDLYNIYNVYLSVLLNTCMGAASGPGGSPGGDGFGENVVYALFLAKVVIYFWRIQCDSVYQCARSRITPLQSCPCFYSPCGLEGCNRVRPATALR